MNKFIIILFFLTYIAYSKDNNYYGKEFVFAVPKNVIFLSKFSNKEININLFSCEDSNEVNIYHNSNLILDTLLNKYEVLNYPIEQIPNIEIFGASHISNQEFKIKCSNNSTVNLISTTFNSTDATLLFPTVQCGTKYTLSSLNNYIKNSNPLDTTNFYSFALIIGLEDNTKINIKSNSKIYNGTNSVNNIDLILDKSEVYYFTAGIDSNIYDLTGSNIISDKKVAVFSGHNCARVLNISNSRDFLLEQIPPDCTNGNEYIIGYFHRKDVEFLPIYRVISLHDSNRITFNKQSFNLNKGEWKQFILDSLTLLKSEKPVIVAEYMKTLPEFILGDPFLLTLTPTQQFVKSYAYTVPQVSEIEKHYVAITCFDTLANKITMNGKSLDINKFDKVQGSNYLYGVFPIYTDSVILNSEYNFGAIAFGVGKLDSYGMNLGSNLRDIENIILDKTPASAHLKNCSNQISIIDTSEFISGIESVTYYNPINLDNINLNSNANEVLIDYKFINPTKDAQISITVVDSSQNRMDTTLNIRGFTIKASLYIPNELGLKNLESWELQLINTGNFEQNLSLLMNNGHLISLPVGLRKTKVDIGETETVSLYSYSDYPEEYIDTLFIYNECSKLIKIPIKVHFGFEYHINTKCDADYLIADKFNRDNLVLKTQLFDTSGKLLQTFDNSFNIDLVKEDFSNRPIIIKEYFSDHVRLRKIFFENH